MNGKEAIKTVLTSTGDLVSWYLTDMDDADLLVRPVPNANHIAWQLGHLISSERHLARGHVAADYPPLPAGFEEQHSKETAAIDPPKGFRTKAEYLDLLNKSRAATVAALEKMSDADLDKPTTGNMAKFAPTVGALLVLTANHIMMHVGQFTVVRRKLGKPILF